LGLVAGPPLAVFLVCGAPLALDRPKLKGFNFAGGHAVSPEFAALLLGLVVYTGTFIAEIVPPASSPSAGVKARRRWRLASNRGSECG
jgi:ABC-type amino acid transport system permease subunit